MYAELVDDGDTTHQLKLTKLFHYASTSVDLTDGMLVDLDLSLGATYGLVHAIAKAGASARGLVPVGVIDHDVDASAWASLYPGGSRLMRVVVAGYKKDILGDGSVAAGYGFVSDASAYGTNAAAITDAVIGYALEADSGSPVAFDGWIMPRLCLGR